MSGPTAVLTADEPRSPELQPSLEARMRALIGELGRLNEELANDATALAVADDLTLIDGIDADLAQRLHRHGVGSFAAIAAWTADEIAGFRAVFGMLSELPLGHWVEQAALLATGAVTDHARRVTARRLWLSPPAIEAPPAEAPAEECGPQLLTLIRGIDEATATQLMAQGVWQYREIADWTAADVAYFAATLGAGDRIAREGWIEQAAVLATGRLTAHAERIELGVPRPVVVPVVRCVEQLPMLVMPALPPAIIERSKRPAARPFLVIEGNPQPPASRRTAIGSLSSIANFALAASLAILVASSVAEPQRPLGHFATTTTLDTVGPTRLDRLAALDFWDRLD